MGTVVIVLAAVKDIIGGCGTELDVSERVGAERGADCERLFPAVALGKSKPSKLFGGKGEVPKSTESLSVLELVARLLNGSIMLAFVLLWPAAGKGEGEVEAAGLLSISSKHMRSATTG